MRIGVAQINPNPGDVAGNTAEIVRVIRRARDDGCELVVFPELALCGYFLGDLVENRAFLRANQAALKEIAEAAGPVATIVGFVDSDPSATGEHGGVRRWNAAAVLQNGAVVGKAHKSLLPSYRYFDDKRHFSPSERCAPISVPIGGRVVSIGVAICEDLWDANYKRHPVEELAERGAELIVSINASPFVPGKFQQRVQLVKRHARALDLPIVYCNTAGSGDTGKTIVVFDGQSFIADARGMISSLAPAFEEHLLVTDLAIGGTVSHQIAMPEQLHDELVWQALCVGTRDYARRSGLSGAIQSVSGGIDSALGLTLCAEVFGPESVFAYSLPSQYNSRETRALAAAVSAANGVRFREMAIDSAVAALSTSYSLVDGEFRSEVTKQNLQARARGVLMMSAANEHNALLVCNSNKTELALGYSTLYGDMCGGIAPLGDVPKHAVYRLARFVNARAGLEIIPLGSIEITPSAELATGQVDPFDYPLIAPLVDELTTHRRSVGELAAAFRARELPETLGAALPSADALFKAFSPASFVEELRKLDAMIRRSVFKRLQAPPVIAVSERAFGSDLRETLSNCWQE